MSAPFFAPFNFQPASYQQGTTGTYTVPAGKYARVTINASMGHTLALTNASAGGVWTLKFLSTNSTNDSFDIWLYSGQTLALAAANSNGTLTVTASGSIVNDADGEINSTAGVSVTVDSVAWRNIQCYSSALATCTVVSTGTATATLTAASSFGWAAQEFNQIT
jgi:hypothetical protein